MCTGSTPGGNWPEWRISLLGAIKVYTDSALPDAFALGSLFCAHVNVTLILFVAIRLMVGENPNACSVARPTNPNGNSYQVRVPGTLTLPLLLGQTLCRICSETFPPALFWLATVLLPPPPAGRGLMRQQAEMPCT